MEDVGGRYFDDAWYAEVGAEKVRDPGEEEDPEGPGRIQVDVDRLGEAKAERWRRRERAEQQGLAYASSSSSSHALDPDEDDEDVVDEFALRGDEYGVIDDDDDDDAFMDPGYGDDSDPWDDDDDDGGGEEAHGEMAPGGRTRGRGRHARVRERDARRADVEVDDDMFARAQKEELRRELGGMPTAAAAAAAAASSLSPDSRVGDREGEKGREEEEGADGDWIPEQGVFYVDCKARAEEAVRMLMSDERRGAWHALAVEAVGVNARRGPVGNGRCVSVGIYCGPGFDFGEGMPKVHVDCTAAGVLRAMEPYFTSRLVRKVWHHYGVQRHLLINTGVRVRTLGADTLHMAKLWDPTRGDQGYDLHELCDLVLDEDGVVDALGSLYCMPRGPGFDGPPDGVEETPEEAARREARLRSPQAVQRVTSQAVLTWHLRKALERKLRRVEWVIEGGGGAYRSKYLGTMWDFYNAIWKPFGEVITNVEDRGIFVDTNVLAHAERFAQADADHARYHFVEWAARKVSEDVRVMNLQSGQQLGHLLFGDALEFDDEGEVVLEQPGNRWPTCVRRFERRLTDEEYIAEQGRREEWAEAETKRRLDEWEEVVKRAQAEDRAAGVPVRKPTHPSLPPKPRKVRPVRVARKVDFALAGLGLPSHEKTPTGRPKVDQHVIEKLAGSEDEPGTAFEFIGAEGCEALRNLSRYLLLDKTLSVFLRPLQQWPHTERDDNRIHTMLNIGTETGRLSSRKPNLQNQPSMERDPYRVREAFAAPAGHSLIVADYGQLELRLLAHMSGCQSMIDTFHEGGDLHSRTAVMMYDHVRKAVEAGECLVDETDLGGPRRRRQESGDADEDADAQKEGVPLLKDLFPMERRNAKTLNFGVAYGQTHYGLAKEWGASPTEAKQIVDRWYAMRPEVKDWQDRVAHRAERTGYTHSLLGRPRPLKELLSPRTPKRAREHALRVAINNPVQGGAADVVTCAMLRMQNNPVLKQLGFRMVLQIHDELILEGPTAFANEAALEVSKCMSQPFPKTFPALLVHLEADAVIAPTWYHAKSQNLERDPRDILMPPPTASFDFD